MRQRPRAVATPVKRGPIVRPSESEAAALPSSPVETTFASMAAAAAGPMNENLSVFVMIDPVSPAPDPTPPAFTEEKTMDAAPDCQMPADDQVASGDQSVPGVGIASDDRIDIVPVSAGPADIISSVPDMTEPDVAPVVPPAYSLTPAQGIAKMMKSTEEFVAFGQANMEAFMKSGQIWAAGIQNLTKQMAATAKISFDESVSTFKAISTAKSVKEAFDLQSGFARTAFEKAMSESNKLTDASIRLTEQTLAPITARVTSTVETMGKPA